MRIIFGSLTGACGGDGGQSCSEHWIIFEYYYRNAARGKSDGVSYNTREGYTRIYRSLRYVPPTSDFHPHITRLDLETSRCIRRETKAIRALLLVSKK